MNVHGDEPFLDPSHVATVVDVLLSVPPNHTRVVGASLRTRLRTQEEATSRAKVKMIINPSDETVLYLSRALIPHSKSGEYNPEAVYWSHINIMWRPPLSLALLRFALPDDLRQGIQARLPHAVRRHRHPTGTGRGGRGVQ